MKINKLLIFFLIISLILHLLLLYIIKRDVSDIQKESNKDQPVEVDIIPKEREPLRDIYEAPITEKEDTTLEHDKKGGERSGSSIQKDNQSKPSSKVVKNKSIDIPKSTTVEDDIKPADEEDNRDINLFDNKDIIEQIAKADSKKQKVQGEDTASYNDFEEKYASYFAKFRQRVYQIWQYPNDAVAKGEQGAVKVSFSILKDGSIVNIRLIESSGYPSLDREVLRVLKNIGRVPLPASYELNQLNVDEAFFIYTIGGGFKRFLR